MSNKGTFPEESALLRQFLLPGPNIISCQIDSSAVQEPGLIFLLVYTDTDTDTVSVRLTYWHSAGTDRTQTSYFMRTTTLRDTHSNMD